MRHETGQSRKRRRKSSINAFYAFHRQTLRPANYAMGPSENLSAAEPSRAGSKLVLELITKDE